ncbi:MAG: NAD(P)/FAD-dependent oxidoreductase, partial [Clostridia bacterium]|nr:NAD(P)/FAD-dependent oxidoreductase [Clostridia bacterium]
MLFDVIIIGMGPAGISAALYVKRAGMSCLIIGKDGGALEKAEKIENYYGLEKVISCSELIEIGKKQAKNLGAELISAEAVGINWDGNYKIETTAGDFSSKAVILAVGSPRNKAKIEGINDFEGMGVSYCAVC